MLISMVLILQTKGPAWGHLRSGGTDRKGIEMQNTESSLQDQLLKQARRFLARPLVKRAYRFEDIAPEYIDTRAPLEPA